MVSKNAELFRSKWYTNEGGYRWEDSSPADNAPGPYLVPNKPALKTYDPLREVKLFLDFTMLETQDEIYAFANKYGQLTFSIAESLRDWRHEITALKEAVWLWEKKKDRASKELQGFFKWDGDILTAPEMYDDQMRDRAAFIFNKDYPGLLGISSTGPRYLPLPGYQQFKHGDVLTPAEKLIEALVSKRLDKYVSFQLENGELHLRIRSLIGAMWFQFAEAVAGHLEYKRCTYCASWMMKFNAKGKQRLFCSNACKQAVKYRKPKSKLSRRTKQ